MARLGKRPARICRCHHLYRNRDQCELVRRFRSRQPATGVLGKGIAPGRLGSPRELRSRVPAFLGPGSQRVVRDPISLSRGPGPALEGVSGRSRTGLWSSSGAKGRCTIDLMKSDYRSANSIGKRRLQNAFKGGRSLKTPTCFLPVPDGRARREGRQRLPNGCRGTRGAAPVRPRPAFPACRPSAPLRATDACVHHNVRRRSVR